MLEPPGWMMEIYMNFNFHRHVFSSIIRSLRPSLCTFKFLPAKVLDKHFSINLYLLPTTFLCPHTRIFICESGSSSSISFMYFFNGFPLVSLLRKLVLMADTRIVRHTHTHTHRFNNGAATVRKKFVMRVKKRSRCDSRNLANDKPFKYLNEIYFSWVYLRVFYALVYLNSLYESSLISNTYVSVDFKVYFCIFLRGI